MTILSQFRVISICRPPHIPPEKHSQRLKCWTVCSVGRT